VLYWPDDKEIQPWTILESLAPVPTT
jgi:hypothetical protein